MCRGFYFGITQRSRPAEGNEKEINELINFCRKGSRLSCVANLKFEYEKFKGEFNDFTIRF